MQKVILPDSIHLAGNRVLLKIDDEILEEGNLGCFYGTKNLIKFHSGAGTNIILHEFIEAILGYYKSTHFEHDNICLLAGGLSDILDQIGIELVLKCQ